MFLRNFWYFWFYFPTENDGCGEGGGVDCAFISKDFFDFLPKSKYISQKHTYYQSKKSNKYFIITRDLIDFFFSNNCALFLSHF